MLVLLSPLSVCFPLMLVPFASCGKDCYLMLLDAARAPSLGNFMEGMKMVNAVEPTTFQALMNIPLPYWTHHASPGDTVIFDQVTSHATELSCGILSEKVRKPC